MDAERREKLRKSIAHALRTARVESVLVGGVLWLLDQADEVERLRDDLAAEKRQREVAEEAHAATFAHARKLRRLVRDAEGWLEETWPRRAEQIREVLGDQ